MDAQNSVVAGALAGGDADNDGFSDEVEAALGSDPFSNASVPAGMDSITETAALPFAKLNIQLNFAKSNRDVIQLNSQLPKAPASSQIIVDVGGVVKTFVLTSKGRTPELPTSVIYRKGALRIFRMKLTKGSFASALADEELTTASAIKESR